MARKRLQVIYAGHVQGVGFRYTVRSLAPGYEVTGRIRNLADGRVELIAEGEAPELESFAQAVLDSGLGRLIQETRMHWDEAQGNMRGFEIGY